MRPFKERFFVVTWILYGGIAVSTLIGATASTYQARRVIANYSTPVEYTIPADKVRSVFAAYKAGRMTAEDAREYVSDIIQSRMPLPPGEVIVLPAHFDIEPSAVLIIPLLLLLPVIAGIALQYLLLGFANPLKLFRR